MHAVILAAGAAPPASRRRKNAPIPLAAGGGRPLIEHQLDFFFHGGVESASVCSTGSDYHLYLDWLRGCAYTGRVEIIDGAASGAAGPLHDLGRLAQRRRPPGGLAITAGDMYYDFPFPPFSRFCGEHDGDVVCVTGAPEDAGGRCGTAVVTANERVIDFIAGTRSRRRGLSAIPLIHLSSETTLCLERYLSDGSGGDGIGSFLEWTYRFRPLYAYRLEGRCFRLDGRAAIRRIASRFEKPRAV